MQYLVGQFKFYLLILAFFNVACGNPQPQLGVDSIAHEPYYQSPLLLTRAWRLPVAAMYKEDLEYQINAAFCGPATAVSVFGSLGVEPEHTQSSLFEKADVGYWKARVMGLTLDEMAELMKANSNLAIAAQRNLSENQFRSYLRKANDPNYRLVINFHRGPLFGVDVGHFSPIGGYLEKQDLVFVLDVLEDYQPFLVPADRLFKAMDTIDASTGQKRGLIVVQAGVEDAAPAKEPFVFQ
jgi:hypothetical protein